MSLKDQLELAKIQRYDSLKAAFDILETFMIPSADPEQFKQFEELREYFLDVYKAGSHQDRLNNILNEL